MFRGKLIMHMTQIFHLKKKDVLQCNPLESDEQLYPSVKEDSSDINKLLDYLFALLLFF